MATHSMQYCFALCALLGIACAYNPYGSCDTFAAESVNEGMCPHRYQDSLGIWTIGIGFNLQQTGAQSVLEGCGGNFAALNQGPNSCKNTAVGSQVISNDVASCLLYHYLSGAETCVQGIMGSQFSSTPRQVISGMIDMAYNMGCAGLKSFSTTIGNVKSGAFSSAASGARSSKWCGQIGARCTRTTACLGNQGGSSGPPPVSPPPPATGSSPPTNGGHCVTFQSGLCNGPSSCMCTFGSSCGSSKAFSQSMHNSTEIEERKRVLIAQGKAATCAGMGGTCYNVVTGACPGSTSCMAYGDRC